MKIEIWKPIKDFELKYKISNLGRIKSFLSNKILKTRINVKNKYEMINLQDGKSRKTFYVHFLVLKSFIGERPNKFDVDHINGIRNDNELKNLRYLHQSINRSSKKEKNV